MQELLQSDWVKTSGTWYGFLNVAVIKKELGAVERLVLQCFKGIFKPEMPTQNLRKDCTV